jgi:hypothetical protein
VHILERVVLADAIVLEDAVACDQHAVLVLVVEGALGHAHVAADACDGLLDEAAALVPGPQDDPDVWLGSQGDQEALLGGGREVDGDELLGAVVGRSQYLAPFEGVGVEDAADGLLGTLADRQELLGR